MAETNYEKCCLRVSPRARYYVLQLHGFCLHGTTQTRCMWRCLTSVFCAETTDAYQVPGVRFLSPHLLSSFDTIWYNEFSFWAIEKKGYSPHKENLDRKGNSFSPRATSLFSVKSTQVQNLQRLSCSLCSQQSSLFFSR